MWVFKKAETMAREGYAVYIDPAPLMGILVLIYVFIGNAQDIQAESGRSGTSGTGSAAQNKVTVRIVIMICRHGITHSVLKSLTNGDGDSVKLFFNGKVCMPSTISPGWASAAGSLPSAIPKFR